MSDEYGWAESEPDVEAESRTSLSNYDRAKSHAQPMVYLSRDVHSLAVSQVHATLAVADELREIKNVLSSIRDQRSGPNQCDECGSPIQKG